jgi:prepilin-type N-terminal cleavage/methylation domain-containing protein
MNRQVIKCFWNQRHGFSLIEVVLAVAVIAVGLMAVIGLFPQGLQSSRETADNTIVATIVQDIFGTIRSQPFTAVNLGTTHNLSTITWSTIPIPDVLWFDQDGYTPATPQDQYFKVDLTFTPGIISNSCVVTAAVTWVVKPGMSTPPVNTSIFTSEVTWYDNP